MHFFDVTKCRRVWVRASKSSLITFLRLVFSGYCFYVFFFFFHIFISFRIFFYFTRTMKIITGCRPWVLTEESPRLTTMDGNTLAVFAGNYTKSLFPLPAFLKGVACIHPGLINLNEIKTPVLEFLLPCIEPFNAIRCATIFLSLHKKFSAVASLFTTVN